MIRVPLYRNRTVAVLGLARSGLAAARALSAGGARVLCWDDAPDARAAARDQGFEVRPAGPEDGIASPGAEPRRAALAPDDRCRARCRRRGGGRYRASVACAAGAPLRRRHRHQRQVDDHGAHRPPAAFGRGPPHPRRRQPGDARARSDAGAGGGDHRPRTLLLPARPHRRGDLRHRRAAQRRPGPSRPPRDHGGLRRREAPGLPSRPARNRRRRHGRSDLAAVSATRSGRETRSRWCR